jgi:protoheme IX farnesyltransferase
VINMYWDRDVDAIMQRTRRRAVPAGRIPPGRALWFGLVLATLAVAVLGPLVNWLSAGLAVAGILFYVFVYTIWLKRSTPQNIVIGGAAGAVPPLVGWAAVTGQVALPAILLFAIIFLWTPPHFWALALHKRQDYAAAGIPMLPVVAGDVATRRQIVRYSLALVVATLLLGPFGGAGPVYLVAALLLGAWFIHLALGIGRDDDHRSALRLFGYSIAYLMLLFTALALDRLL